MPSCYKLGLIKTLVYRRYRIHNSWAGFDKDLKDLKNVLQKIQYDHKVRDHAVKSNLNDKVNCRNQKKIKPPFIGLHSKRTQKKGDQLCESLCKKKVFSKCEG